MRQIMPALLLVLTFLGCKRDPRVHEVLLEDADSSLKARQYMEEHFPGTQAHITCLDDMRLYLQGENFHFCTVTAGTRILTLGCKSDVTCVLLGSIQQ